MAHNKDSIRESELVTMRERGQFNLFGMERVDEGFHAVVTLDGRQQETSGPGSLFLGRYNPIREIKVYYVNMRPLQMTVKVLDELTIEHPSQMQLEELSVVVTYRVVDAATVALHIERPLADLFDRAVEAIRYAVTRLEYRDFLVGGSAGQLIFDHLRSQGMEHTLAIAVLSVRVSNIRGHARANKVIEDEVLKPREEEIVQGTQDIAAIAENRRALAKAMNERDMDKITELTHTWIIRNHPELVGSVLGDATERNRAILGVLEEMIKLNMVPGGAILDWLRGSLAGSTRGALGQGGDWSEDKAALQGRQPQQPALEPRMVAPPVPPAHPEPYQAPAPARPPRWSAEPDVQPVAEPQSVESALAQEVAAIQQELGIDADLLRPRDRSGYLVLLMLPTNDGASRQLIMHCPLDYPRTPPVLLVMASGQSERVDDLQESVARTWATNPSLTRVVRLAHQYFEHYL